MKRGTNPKSLEALKIATKKRKKNAQKANMTLSPEAIALLDTEAQKQGISRSELVERYARSLGIPPGLSLPSQSAV